MGGIHINVSLSFSQHLSQLILAPLSLSSHFFNLDTFNMALSFERYKDFSSQW